ncbi:MAG: PilZ domain-containing protein [Spirochaetaceae bacterium]|nr:PilZ domain-containing protein [Spirochaetaceae bacterium]
MLFIKKNQAEDQNLGNLALRAPRYNSVAHIMINGFDGKALLRNISQSGFRMESRTYAALTPGEYYTMRLLPEESSHIKPFEVTVEVRWIQSTETKFSAGFLISKLPADRSFEKYINYIKERSTVAA